jgi:hypothetical protein
MFLKSDRFPFLFQSNLPERSQRTVTFLISRGWTICHLPANRRESILLFGECFFKLLIARLKKAYIQILDLAI